MPSTSCNQPRYNLNLNHVAVSVPNLEEAVKWYTGALGFRQIRSDQEACVKEDPDGVIFQIYGSGLQQVKIAFLSTGNGVGFEIFEFKNPKYEGPTTHQAFDHRVYARGGFFHIAITAPDPEEVCKKIVSAGGCQIGKTIQLPGGESALYTQDPWGNVIEVLSSSFEALMANK